MTAKTSIPYFHVDAFTSHVFSGNPAGVCPLQQWLDDATLQNIAAENNLSETAFFVKKNDLYELRWFTRTNKLLFGNRFQSLPCQLRGFLKKIDDGFFRVKRAQVFPHAAV
jgi:hypothetical protein